MDFSNYRLPGRGIHSRSHQSEARLRATVAENPTRPTAEHVCPSRVEMLRLFGKGGLTVVLLLRTGFLNVARDPVGHPGEFGFGQAHLSSCNPQAFANQKLQKWRQPKQCALHEWVSGPQRRKLCIERPADSRASIPKARPPQRKPRPRLLFHTPRRPSLSSEASILHTPLPAA